MANIFQLFGSIFIDNEKANTAIEETDKKASSSGKSMGTSFSSIAKGAAAMATAVVSAASAIGAGLYKMASSTAEAADKVDKGSQQIGFSTEAYQKWDYVLSQNGASIDNLATYTARLTNTLDDAKNGSESAIAKFERLGLSVDELAGKSREEVFEAVIASLADMTDEAERTAIANDLLGNKSSALAAMLNGGSAAIEEMKDKASELGMVMSEDTIKAGVNFTDLVDTTKRSLKGAISTLGGTVLPIINKVLNAVIQKLPSITNMIKKAAPIVEALADQVLPPLFELAEQIFPLLMDLFSALLPVISEIIGAILPVIIDLLKTLLPPIIQIAQGILPIVIQLLNLLVPILNLIAPILTPILELLTAILSPLLELISGILEPLISILTTLMDAILKPLTGVMNSTAGTMTGSFMGAFQSILSVIENVKKHFQLVIDFVKNIFAGDWKAAWGNIKDIFANMWEGIKNVGKGALNGLISIFEMGLNGIIKFINMITQGVSKIWDWTGIPSIPKIPEVNIPRLRIGMERVPFDDFPALLHKGERVLRAGESEEYERMLAARAAEKEKPEAGGGDVNVDVNINIEHFGGSAEELDDLKSRILEIVEEAINRRRRAQGA